MPTAEDPGKLHYPTARPTSESTGNDKKAEADHAKQWIASLSAETVCAYSDGFSCGPAKSAWGYTLYSTGQMIGSGSGSIPVVEAYDAEQLGAQKAMEEAIKKAKGGPVKVLLDNPNAVRALRSGRKKSS